MYYLFAIVVLLVIGYTALVIAEACRLWQDWQRERERQRRELPQCAYLQRRLAIEAPHLSQYLPAPPAHFKGYPASLTEYVQQCRSHLSRVEGIRLGYCEMLREWQFPVIQTEALRGRHTYIIGKPGYGKTNLLRHMIAQSARKNEGFCVIAPEYEFLTQEIIPFLPAHRLKEVVYIDPANPAAPPLNPLHLLRGDQKRLDQAVDDVVTIFRQLTDDFPPRAAEIFRQALYALIPQPNTTLQEVLKLLNPDENAYRQSIARRSSEKVRHFLLHQYPAFPRDAWIPIAHRLGRFIASEAVSRVLLREGCVDLRQVMDEGKILLCNCSDGILGSENAAVLGQLLVSRLQLAALSRADMPPAERRPFYLYLDEFQTFTRFQTRAYEVLLERARKYRLPLILAHQQSGQLSSAMFKQVTGCVDSIISFCVDEEDARKLSAQLTFSDRGRLKQISAQKLQTLNIGQGFARLKQQTLKLHVPLFKDIWAARRREENLADIRALDVLPVQDQQNQPETEQIFENTQTAKESAL